jgi:4-hydroxy-tetrahydrodipicolinate synthase
MSRFPPPRPTLALMQNWSNPMAFLSGLSAFPITPSDRDGRVDTKALRKLVTRLCDAKVDSIGLLGSTGTYIYLTREERRAALANSE